MKLVSILFASLLFATNAFAISSSYRGPIMVKTSQDSFEGQPFKSYKCEIYPRKVVKTLVIDGIKYQSTIKASLSKNIYKAIQKAATAERESYPDEAGMPIAEKISVYADLGTGSIEPVFIREYGKIITITKGREAAVVTALVDSICDPAHL